MPTGSTPSRIGNPGSGSFRAEVGISETYSSAEERENAADSRRAQIVRRRTLDPGAVGAVPGRVQRAVPRQLLVVPADDAPEMRADGADLARDAAHRADRDGPASDRAHDALALGGRLGIGRGEGV